MEISENFYNKNYKLFSDTRFCLWDIVKEFSNNFKDNSYVLDAGCGNGKNIKYFNDKCNIIGIDKCQKFVEICSNQGFNVYFSDIRDLPFENNTFDFVMSIAVVHHFDKEEDRIKAVKEMIRVLKPNGKLLFTVWAYESDEYSSKKQFNIGDNIVNFKNSKRYYYIYDKSMFYTFCKKFDDVNITISWDRGNWNCILQKIEK